MSAFLDCVELNKFESTPSEAELVTRGLQLIESNKLWAGLVFVDIKDGKADKSYIMYFISSLFDLDETELPKFLTYKIRIDADKVDSTKRYEDRLSRPGPRRRPGIDLKYLYYGFAYLQVLLSKIKYKICI